MRFLELQLQAFGPFTGTRLDLDAGGPALHLIYGSNEAGKSSTLRAVFGLLYGIEHTTGDAHLHAMSELRIGGRLCDAAGRTLDVVRRKGHKHTLLDREERALPDTALVPFLHGIAEPMYRASFGLDHVGLRDGAEALLAGKGDLGESLFQAGLGLRGVHEVLVRLDDEAGKLFKPRGSKQRINDALAELKDALKRSRDEAFSADAWQEERRAYDEALSQRTALTARLEGLRRDKTRLDRIRQVASRVAERARLLARRAELGDVVALEPDAAARRRTAVAELEDAERALARLGVEQARVSEKHAALEVPESLLGVADATIRELRILIGKDEAARRDRPKRESELRELEKQAKAVLRRLGRRAGKDQLATADVESGLAARIQSLSSEQSGLAARLEHAQQAREACRAQLARAQQRSGAPERAAHGGSAASASDAPLPSHDQVQHFEREQRELEARRQRLDERAGDLVQAEERIHCDIDALQGEGEVPTEAQLLTARGERDADWEGLARVLELDPVDAPAARDRLQSAQASSVRADALGDRLRREAGRVSQLARLTAERNGVARQLARHREEQAALEAAVADRDRRWAALWQPIGEAARSPAEMQAWLLRREQTERARREQTAALTQAEDALDAAEVAVTAAARRYAAWRTDWASQVARIELGPEVSVEEAHDALEALNELAQLKTQIDRMQGRIDGMARDREAFEREVSRLADRHIFALGDMTTEERADQLVRRHEAAKLDAQQRADLDRDLDRIAAELSSERLRRESAQATLVALQRAARVDGLPELEQAERRSDELRRISVRLEQLETELLEEGAGASPDELARQTQEVDPDALPHRLAELEAELTELIAQQVELAGRIVTHEIAMRGHDSSQLAADAASDAALQLAAIREHTARYVRLRLAARVLEREIGRYRDAHQGPILALADRFFVRLTLGRYTRLEVGFDDGDEPELHCIDAQGRKVPITGLSEGTRDALYLALRLASLLRHGERDELMPLVLDDVLIHFDDDRARAALALLGEVSHHTQVLFFTHHARDRQLAREAVEPTQLREHELPSAAARDAAAAAVR